MPLYRIKDWDDIYENHRSRPLKKLDWVPVPNKMDGSGYIELVEHPNGAAHLGAWLVIIEIASKQEARGTLPVLRGSTAAAIARSSRLPLDLLEEAIARLLSPEIGWLEECPQSSGEKSAVPPRPLGELPALPERPSGDESATKERKKERKEGNEREKRRDEHAETEWPESAKVVIGNFPAVQPSVFDEIVSSALSVCQEICDQELACGLRETRLRDQRSATFWIGAIKVWVKRNAGSRHTETDKSPPAQINSDDDLELFRAVDRDPEKLLVLKQEAQHEHPGRRSRGKELLTGYAEWKSQGNSPDLPRRPPTQQHIPANIFVMAGGARSAKGGVNDEA